jgi:hypothetical protein
VAAKVAAIWRLGIGLRTATVRGGCHRSRPVAFIRRARIAVGVHIGAATSFEILHGCQRRKSRNFASVDIAILRRRERCAPQIKAGAADLRAILCADSGFFPPRAYCAAI